MKYDRVLNVEGPFPFPPIHHTTPPFPLSFLPCFIILLCSALFAVGGKGSTQLEMRICLPARLPRGEMRIGRQAFFFFFTQYIL